MFMIHQIGFFTSSEMGKSLLKANGKILIKRVHIYTQRLLSYFLE